LVKYSWSYGPNEVCDRDIEEVNQQEREEGIFERGELPGRFMAKKLFG